MAADSLMISYAQNFEDVVLARVFADVPYGFYVDVGANHPVQDSLTKHFSDRGWRGINVEPGRYYPDLVAARPDDVNLDVAVSDKSGPVTFYEGASPGLAGLLPEVPEALRFIVGERTARTVQARTLREILTEHAQRITIDFLSVDVEGHERATLAGNDWQRFRPRVVLVEATLPGSPIPCHELWEDILLGADYRFAYFDGLNRFYIRAEDDAKLRPRFGPPCVFDRFIVAELALLRAGNPSVNLSLRELMAERDMLARHVENLQAQLRPLQKLTENIGWRSLRLSLWMAQRLTLLKRSVLPRRPRGR